MKSKVEPQHIVMRFVPNPENKPYVNHINGLKVDNTCENLEWITHQENIRHAYDTGLLESNKGNNHHAATVIVNELTGEKWDTIKGAASALKVNYNTLRNQLNTQCVAWLKKQKTSGTEVFISFCEN